MPSLLQGAEKHHGNSPLLSKKRAIVGLSLCPATVYLRLGDDSRLRFVTAAHDNTTTNLFAETHVTADPPRDDSGHSAMRTWEPRFTFA